MIMSGVSALTTTTRPGDVCQTLCLSTGCPTSDGVFCNTSGMCENMHWTDETRTMLDLEGLHVNTISVTCYEARRWLIQHSIYIDDGSSGSDADYSANAPFYDLLMEIGEFIHSAQTAKALRHFPFSGTIGEDQLMTFVERMANVSVPASLPGWARYQFQGMIERWLDSIYALFHASSNTRSLHRVHADYSRMHLQLFSKIQAIWLLEPRINVDEIVALMDHGETQVATTELAELILNHTTREPLESGLTSALSLPMGERTWLADTVCAWLETQAIAGCVDPVRVGHLCGVDRLSPYMRLRVIPSTHLNVGSTGFPMTLELTSPIDRSSRIMTALVAMNSVETFPNHWSHMDVTIDGVRGDTGGVARAEFVVLAIREVAKSDHGLFVASISEDRISLVPSAPATAAAMMTAVGRIVGIGIMRGIPVHLPLADAALFFLMQSPYTRTAGSLDAETLEQWAQVVSPTSLDHVRRMRLDLDFRASRIGSPFTGDASSRVFNGENLEEYIKAFLWVKVCVPLRRPSLALLRGIYQVLPYASFELFTLPELRELFNGALQADLAVGRPSERGIVEPEIASLIDDVAVVQAIEGFPIVPTAHDDLAETTARLRSHPIHPGLTVHASLATRDRVRFGDDLMVSLAAAVLSSRVLRPESVEFAKAVFDAFSPISILLVVNRRARSVIRLANSVLRVGNRPSLGDHEGFMQLAGAPAIIPGPTSGDGPSSLLVGALSTNNKDDFVNALDSIRESLSVADANAACAEIEANVWRYEPHFTFAQRYTVLRFLSAKCGTPFLSFRARSKLIPRLFVRTLTAPRAAPETITLRSPFGSTDLLAESLITVAAMPKSSLSGPLEVQSIHSAARGDGVTLAWLASVLRSALDPASGLFSPSVDGSTVMPVGVSQMRDLGRLMGLSIARGMTPGIPLTSGCLYWFTYDLASVEGHSDIFESDLLEAWGREEDSDFVKNLLKVRDDTAVLDAMIDADFAGPSDHRTLDRGNVDHYIKAKLWHRFVQPYLSPCRSLLTGITDALPTRSTFEWFTIPELRTMINGPTVVDREELRRSSTFRNALNDGEPAAEWDWFWEIVMAEDEFSSDLFASLLEFVSGSRRPPIGGFSGHSGDQTWLQVLFDSSLPIDGYPRSQTCFKQVKIPRYTNKAVMRERLIAAITDGNSLELV